MKEGCLHMNTALYIYIHTYIDVPFYVCLYLHIICVYTYFAVTILAPPENATVNIGSNVTISCGYQSASAVPVKWIINGTSFTQRKIVDSPLYQLNNPTSPSTHSLTVISINHTTTFQCVVNSTTSTLGTVTLTAGMYVSMCVCEWFVN